MSGFLFDMPPDGDVTQAELARRCTAAKSGTGPDGETCRTCAHRVRARYRDRVYQKCGLCRKQWTHGPGSDIKVYWNACMYWERSGGAE